ncbi:MAG: hypothetical protein Ct9H300mP25_07200 [Acidobacteriota bacterium]|nr:MAG: hypothetical protein Ct9H300mP25_07200 [Acidobacteriota bacterium]
MPFPTITLSSGETVRLDQAAYGKHRASQNRSGSKVGFRYLLAKHGNLTNRRLVKTLDTHVQSARV